jgi:ankyrin repeat protein
MMYDYISKGVEEQNAKIKSAVNAHAKPAELQRLQSPDEIAATVNRQFPVALFFIESLDKKFTDQSLTPRFPGAVIGYKPFVGVRKNVDIGISPFRAWNSACIRAYGVYMGDDKIGHFSDMGMHYFQTYREAKRKGASEDVAVREAIRLGTDGPLYSEKGLLGWATAGAYSNADLVANYMGFVFYRNLTEQVSLKGQRRPAMLERWGPYWKLAPHVRPDSEFFSWFISDHLNEALNPSFYLAHLRGGIRRAIVDSRKTLMPRYFDVNGDPRSPEWFATKTEQLKTYYGFDYGHLGDSELIRMSDACFAKPPDPSKPKSVNGDGLTPLHFFAIKGDVQAIQSLLDSGAAVNAKVALNDSAAARRGDTPLHLAAREGKLEAVALLLSRGADARVADDEGITPLHMAARWPEVAGALMAAGADVDAVDQTRRTPLHWAANDPAGASYDVLLVHHAKVAARDREQRTPMHLAARAGNTGALGALIRSAAEVNAVDQFNQTPLHLAAAAGPTVCDQLLSAGAAPTPRDDFGGTPLHVAVRTNQRLSVTMLLSRGADPSAADVYGGTPLAFAQRHGLPTIAGVLQKALAEAPAAKIDSSSAGTGTR